VPNKKRTHQPTKKIRKTPIFSHTKPLTSQNLQPKPTHSILTRRFEQKQHIFPNITPKKQAKLFKREYQ
jgi:hypothetical protein